jgi:hypothetical protein
MLHQVQQAVNPFISLKTSIENWDKISAGLAENHRQRKSQVSRYTFS